MALPPSALPLPNHAHASTAGAVQGQLSAIEEATPVNEKAPPSPDKSPSSSGSSGSKGKEKELAQHAGCSTPEGRHDPLDGSD